LAAQLIRLGEAHCVVAGGTESMTQAPHLFPKARFGVKFGHTEMWDSLVVDGLSDAFGKFAMGIAAEATVKEYQLTREEQDNHAATSYTRAKEATEKRYFESEIIPVEAVLPNGKPGKVISVDEEPGNFQPDKMRTLRPSFDPQGTVTAANSSPLSDGAAALVMVSGERLQQMVTTGRIPRGTVIFKIKGFADAEQGTLVILSWFKSSF
jgi:acetyl-CoA C-acetyltransferase